MNIKNGSLISADGMAVFNYWHVLESCHQTVISLSPCTDHEQTMQDLCDAQDFIEESTNYQLFGIEGQVRAK